MNQKTSSELDHLAERQSRTQFWLVALIIGITIGLVAKSYFQPPSTTAEQQREQSRKELKEAGKPFRKNAAIFNRVSKFVQPSVVNISTKTPEFNFWGLPRNRKNEGTGVILDKEGYILTNHHVVKGENSRIQVTLSDDRVFQAKRVGFDPLMDLAIVKIDANNLTPAVLGDSQSLKVGEWVLAVGSPFGLSQSVSTGIISALDRGKGRLPTTSEGYIQTDASINPGNSGGPLVNLKGEVIGINTMILSKSGGSQGVGFAIPINSAQQMVERMRKEGRVEWGYIGVQTANLTEDDLPVIRRTIRKKYNVLVKSKDDLLQALKLDQPRGVIVLDVDRRVPPSPAQKVGIQPLDVILSFGGTEINNSGQLRSLILNAEPESTVSMIILRRGKEVKITVPVGRRN